MLKTVGNPSTRYGDQTIVSGNLVIGTAGKGIDFSIDPSAPGMTSELLDDYEEGTWTPAIRGAATAGTYELATAEGRYTKVGDLVTVWCRVVAAAVVTGGGTAYLLITGFPFANASLSQGAVVQFGLQMTTNYTWIVATPAALSGTTNWYLQECGPGQNGNDLPVGNFGANDSILFTASYRV
jgi:hypothetical protein